jgi:uncharacterized membrane protein YkvA (DUF1232 family)
MAKSSWRERARRLEADVCALVLAFKDPRTPWYAKALITGIVAYALSPIDLIPDFIPVLGYLDDLIILPAGIYLVIKLIPRELMDECRQKATAEKINTRFGWIAATVIICLWLLIIFLVTRAVLL